MDVVAVLEIVVEEVKILITVSQVIKNLINLRLSVITVRIMDIMHMKRDSIIRTSKVEPYVYGHTEAMPIVSPLECNVAQESPCDIRYLDSRYSKEMTWKLELFSSLDKLVQNKVTLGIDIQVLTI